MATHSSHVVIIGGGIIGLSTAYFLLQKGHKVTVLERGSVGYDSCALGCAGMVCPSHFIPLAAPGMVAMGLKWMWNPESPFYIKPRLSIDLLKWGWKFMRAATPARVQAASVALRDLSLLSRKLYLEWESSLGTDMGLQQRGMLMLCQTEAALAEETHMAAQANALGIAAEALTSAQVCALDPNIQMNVCGGVYFPQDCHLNPSALMHALTQQIHALGGLVRYQSDVQDFQINGRRVSAVATTNGRYEADEFLICGGVWSQRMTEKLQVSLPMQAGKGYSLTMPKPPAVADICSILVEARVAVTPMQGGMRFGGTMEIAGLDQSINPRRVQGIINGVTKYFPQYSASDFAGIQPWSGLRPCSPDGLPYLGRCGSYDNLSAATGHAMLGLSLAPATGWALAEMLSGLQPAVLGDLFSPDRFA